MKRFLPVFVIGVLCYLPCGAQTALSPGAPAITVAPSFVPGAPALSAAPVGSSAVDTNVTLLQLTQALRLLQANVQQSLPIVVLFNDNFDFVNLNGNVLNTNPPPNMSQNFANNFATSFGVNTAVSTGSLFNTNTAINLAATAPTGVPVGSGFPALPVSRDTLRALLVVQSDLERLLPLLNALNGGAANVPGTFTNLFGVVSVNR